MSRIATAVSVRPYSEADEGEVLQLLDAALGGGPVGERSAAFFRWKHVDNPFGRSYMLVAEADGRIVGLRAFMRWEFAAQQGRFRAVRAVDTATHPEYQGQGIFTTLTMHALDDLRTETDFVFNTPNGKSLPGYLKMGWQPVGQIPIFVRVRRPLRFLKSARSWRAATETSEMPRVNADPAEQVLAAQDIDALLAVAESFEGISTPRSTEYLRWRYGGAPLVGYRAVTERVGGRLEGLALFRVRPRGRLVEATIAEIITRAGAADVGRRMLRAIRASTPVDHLSCSFPRGSSAIEASKRAGFLRVPGGLTLVVNPLGRESKPDPLDLASWSLAVGDVELF